MKTKLLTNNIPHCSVANLAALGCVRFCIFLTFLTVKFDILSERTRTREINHFLLESAQIRGSIFFSKQLMQSMQGYFHELMRTF